LADGGESQIETASQAEGAFALHRGEISIWVGQTVMDISEQRMMSRILGWLQPTIIC